MYWQYYLPTKLVFGWGSIETLPEYIREIAPNAKRILFVTGRSAMKELGFTARTLTLLKKYNVVLFDKVETDPSIETIEKGLKILKEHKIDIVIGMGGGSVLDVGKAIAILSKNKGTVTEYQRGKKIEKEGLPFIAIPTTSGTSSEMTVFSVILTIDKNYKKSFSDIKMYPKIGIIDPELTVSMPPKLTASTGVDALCHAIEAYWSKKTQPLSRILALDALKLIIKYLPIAVKNGQNPEAREKMSLATMLAGLSFSNSRTTSPHKVSYPLTINFKVPHGAACALTLPYFMEFFGLQDEKIIKEILDILEVKDTKTGVLKLKKFIKSLGMPTRLRDIGATKKDLDYIVEKSYFPKKEQQDPVPMEKETFKKILETAL